MVGVFRLCRLQAVVVLGQTDAVAPCNAIHCLYAFYIFINAHPEECILRMQTLLFQRECRHLRLTWTMQYMLNHRASSPRSGVTWGCTQCTEDVMGIVRASHCATM